MKGVVAAGHKLTAKAAVEILQDGGNAFDAVISAYLAACVTEPVLSSLGGGGFLMAKPSNAKSVLYDFFVQTPIQEAGGRELDFYPIQADFGEAGQTFHIGCASMATPGTVKGIFAIHRDHCTLPMKRLAEPAIRLAREGVTVNEFQSSVFDIIEPIYKSNGKVREFFKSNIESGKLLRPGDHFNNSEFGDLLEAMADEGEELFYKGDFAEKVTQFCRENGGLLTMEDFENYQVIKREPLYETYRGETLIMNPPPSSGGSMILFALKLMEKIVSKPIVSQKPDQHYFLALTEVQYETEKCRLSAMTDSDKGSDHNPLEGLIQTGSLVENALNAVKNRLNVSRGTTHVSIIDGDGNMAALSTSNGEGSGIMVPGTGVMMNNMLGEEDLNPAGLQKWQQNQRMTSMMSPGFLLKQNGTEFVFGSGGSSRIRTALLQVILNLIDFQMSPHEAVHAPRIHAEADYLNIEPGFTTEIEKILLKRYPRSKRWETQSLYFGGTHIVSRKGGQITGTGDPRRGGVFIRSLPLLVSVICTGLKLFVHHPFFCNC